MKVPLDSDVPIAFLEHHLGVSDFGVNLVGGGGNSRVFRIDANGGRRLILKCYHRSQADPRDRLGAEVAALTFMRAHGITCIPGLVAVDETEQAVLLEFIEGTKVGRPSDIDLEAARGFLVRLQALSGLASAKALPVASEARFSLAEVAESVQARFDLLVGSRPEAGQSTLLGGFLQEDLLPAWEALRADLERLAMRHGMAFDQEIPHQGRTLSPSDFGFHNALNTSEGLVFLDFEYFGWDDPAKLLSDFLLHPAMDLEAGQRRNFAESILSDLPLPRLRDRTRLAYPLFGMKWCAILLNEFLPSHLTRRRFAATGPLNTAERQAIQLEKCRRKLQQVLDEHAHFTCFDASF